MPLLFLISISFEVTIDCHLDSQVPRTT